MRVHSNWRWAGAFALAALAGGAGWLATGPEPVKTAITWSQKWRGQQSLESASSAQQRLLADYGKTPLHFEPNQGQSDPAVKFLARGGGYALFLTPTEAVLRLRQHQADGHVGATTVLRASLVDSNPQPRLRGEARQEGYSNYFIGDDPHRWQSGVPHYGRVHYEGVWPGIDLVYYGNQRQLEYDFVVRPGANPGLIRMRWQGADNLYIDNDGNLIAETALGPVRQHKPVIYQDIAGKRQPVAGRYALAGHTVSFQLGHYDQRHPLVIDPVLTYSTYLGGGTLDDFNLTGIAVTPEGSAVITGYSDDVNYPITTDSYQQARGAGYNAVVTRLGYSGSTVVYSTFLGGSTKPGRGLAIAINNAGEAYVAGTTAATDFPTTSGAYQTRNSNSKTTGFVSKLAADGKSLLYSTYLGGSGGGSNGDQVTAITLDSSGRAVVAGITDSSNFPIAGGALTSKPAGAQSGFVSVLNSGGSGLVASSFLGGNGNLSLRGLALSASAIYVAGSTSSTDLPAALNSASGGVDGFVAKLASDTSSLAFSRYIGGSADDEVYGLALDDSENIWLAGSTQSTNFPADASDSVSKTGSGESPFLTRLDSSGASSAGYSRVLGTAGRATAVAADSQNHVVVVGQMTASFTTLKPLSLVTASDSTNGFIQQWQNNSLLFSSALGGNSLEETINALTLDATGTAYVAGRTRSSDFPLVNQAFGYNTGAYAVSGFASKINFGPTISLSQSSSSTGVGKSFSLSWETFGASSCRWADQSSDVAAGDITSGTRVETLSTLGSNNYTFNCTAADGQKSSATVTVKIVAPPTINLSISPNPVAADQDYTITWTTTDTNATGCYATITLTNTETVDPVTSTATVETSGNITDSTSVTGIYEYKLVCSGAGSDTPATQIVNLEVVGKPALTLTAAASANPLLVGDSVTYTWSATPSSGNGVVSCTTSGVMSGARAISGSETVAMTATGNQTLSMTCTGPSGASITKTATVYVLDATRPPVINSFSAAPASLKLYRSTVLSWDVENAVSCSASADAGAATDNAPGNWNWSGNRTLVGSYTVTPQTVARHNYVLTCEGPGGSTSRDIDVDVTTPEAAVISGLLVSPSTIALGQSTTVSWQASYADSCVASGDWSGSKNPLGSSLLKPTREGTLTLTLSCSGAGGTDTRSTSLTVTAPATSGDNSITTADSGSADWLLLGGLGWLAWRQRRQSAARGR